MPGLWALGHKKKDKEMNRREAMDNLMASDPDVVVDLLGITTEELIQRFRSYVSVYLDEQVGDEYGTEDEGDE